jgi:K+-sensing histidine kinase KdpD
MRVDLWGTVRARGHDGPQIGALTPIVICIVAVLLTSLALHTIDTYLTAQHLVLGYLLPTMLIAVYFGSTFAVLTSFVSALAAAFVLFPPKFSFYIADLTHVAELGFFLLLASVASKAVAVLTDDRTGKTVRSPRRRG